MAKMDEAGGAGVLAFLEEMGQAYRDEIAALEQSRIE